MPCMAPTDQLKLSSDQLSWSAGARYGNKESSKLEVKTLCEPLEELSIVNVDTIYHLHLEYLWNRYLMCPQLLNSVYFQDQLF